MKAYKIEILVIDHENVGEKDIKELIENTRYIAPQIKNIECADIGEWTDDHPLNKHESADEEYQKLFGIAF